MPKSTNEIAICLFVKKLLIIALAYNSKSTLKTVKKIFFYKLGLLCKDGVNLSLKITVCSIHHFSGTHDP